LDASLKPENIIQAAAGRHGPETVYHIAVDWRLLPDFKPAGERSLAAVPAESANPDMPRVPGVRFGLARILHQPDLALFATH
jgi:hypothetical protein